MYSFPNLEPVCCSMSSSNCCFLTCIQVSQEAGQVVLYPHLFQNFPQFIVILTINGFGIVNKAEIDVFLEFSCFFDDPADVGNLISGSSAFSKTNLNIWKFTVLFSLTFNLNINVNSSSNWNSCIVFLHFSYEKSSHSNVMTGRALKPSGWLRRNRMFKLPHNCTHLTRW